MKKTTTEATLSKTTLNGLNARVRTGIQAGGFYAAAPPPPPPPPPPHGVLQVGEI